MPSNPGKSVSSSGAGGLVIVQRFFDSLGRRAGLGVRCVHLDAKPSH